MPEERSPTIEELGDADGLRAQWSRLAQRSRRIFATQEWVDAWWRHHGEGREAVTLGCYDADGVLIAIVPLCVARERPIRVARFAGYGPSDENGAIGAPQDAPAALPAAIASWGRGGVLLADRLVGDVDWAGAMHGTELGRESSPVIDLAGQDWEEYLASRSSNFRSQVRRKERKLVRDEGLCYRLCDDPERLDADLSTLFSLHRARWGSERSGAYDGARGRFHRDFAATALERGWLRLWIAEVRGEPIAAWHGFRFADAELYYQFGRDPTWDRASIGIVLLAHTIRAAADDGVPLYRLLRGGESYKQRFATSDPGVVTVAAASGIYGRAAIFAARAVLALPAPVRRVATSRAAR